MALLVVVVAAVVAVLAAAQVAAALAAAAVVESRRHAGARARPARRALPVGLDSPSSSQAPPRGGPGSCITLNNDIIQSLHR